MSRENREELSRGREHRALEAWSCREESVAGRNPAEVSEQQEMVREQAGAR